MALRKWNSRDWVVFSGCVLPLVMLGLFVNDSYILHIFIICFIWIIVVSAWDLLLGYGGVLSFAQLAFFAIGAYASAMISIYMSVSPGLAVIFSVIVSGFFGVLVALPCMRLRGEYVALFTFAVHLALPVLLEQGRQYGTGGASGIVGIFPIELGPIVLSADNKVGWYFFLLALSAFCVILIYNTIIGGRLGRALVALRDSERFSQSLGINRGHVTLIMFAISSALTGFAGALYAHYLGIVTPRILGHEFFLLLLVMLCVGGAGRFPGVIIGAFAITIANELLRGTGQFRLLLLGAAVLLTVLLLPNGLYGLIPRAKALVGRSSAGAKRGR